MLNPLELLKPIQPLIPLKLVKHFQPFQHFVMQELVDKLVAEAGLTEEQAKKAITAVKDYVVEKFPMLEGAVGNLFGS